MTTIEKIGQLLVETMRANLSAAGHRMTGDLIKSVEAEFTVTAVTARIDVVLNHYGLALDQGVPPERIPYSPGSGRKNSKYIDGLKRFAMLKLRATDVREAERIAFAIARKHLQTGMPTKGPTRFIAKTVADTQAEITALAEEWATEALGRIIEPMFKFK